MNLHTNLYVLLEILNKQEIFGVLGEDIFVGTTASKVLNPRHPGKDLYNRMDPEREFKTGKYT